MDEDAEMWWWQQDLEMQELEEREQNALHKEFGKETLRVLRGEYATMFWKVKDDESV